MVTAALAVLVLACSPEPLGPGGAPESVAVAPSLATVSVGATLTLSAEVRDAGGTLLTGQRIAWASEDASIAEVSPSGVVTGRKIGTVLISASARGKDAFARVSVNPTPVASIRLSATHRAMFVGEVLQLTAETLDENGNVLQNRPVEWSSGDPAIATVTAQGLVTAVAVGGAIITASSEGRSAIASITVSSVPVASVVVTPSSNDLVVAQTTQLSAEVRDANGAPLTGRTVTWSTSNAQIATVTSQGVVTAIAPGAAGITASSEGQSGTATINVSPRPVSAVIVSPGQMAIFQGQSAQLNVLVTDDRGQVLTGRPISFSSSDAQVASVSGTGVVTGVRPGSAVITATSEGGSGTATVTVSPEPVASVEISPSGASLVVGQAIQMTAIARNGTGQILTGRSVSWISGAPGLATVSPAGVVTGVSPGNAVIIATIDGKQASALVSVRFVPVASVTVTPSTASAIVGRTVTLVATTRDANGTLLQGRVVGWSSSDNAVATVSNNGVVTGVSVGNVTITATSEGQTGTATVAVTLVPVATVSVTPNQASVLVGQTVSLTATTQDANGNTLTGRAVSWSSSAPSVATVSNSGVVTGIGSGTAVITATSEGQTGTATITVSVPTPVLTTITVAPSAPSVVVGSTVALTATPRDQFGNVMSGVTITWSSGTTAVATVSSGGVVTGVAPGNATITASSGSVTGTAMVTVQQVPVDRIVVTPNNAQIKAGQTVQLTATLYDSQNRVLTGRTVTWSSSDPSKLTVDSNGLARGIKKGTVTVTASSGGKSGSVSVRVD